MKSFKRICDFKENVSSAERFYPFHSGESKDLQSSINKVTDYLKGLTIYPLLKDIRVLMSLQN